MKIFSLLFFIISLSINVYSQKLIDIKQNNTAFKFPEVVYTESLVIEEKINNYLQLKYLNHLPGDFKQHPFERIINKKKAKSIRNFNSFKNRKFNKKILSIQLNGVRKNKPFEVLEHFDIRTGDYFTLMDLFNDEGQEKIRKDISNKIKEWVNKGEVPSLKHKPNLSYKLLNDKLVTIFLKLNKTFELTYDELKPYMSDYGRNLLFTSKEIIRRPDLKNKLLKGEGILYKGSKYETKGNYSVLIFGIDKKNRATMYGWENSLKYTSIYFKSIITENQIKGENIIWDERQQKKINMQTILLNKNDEGNWEGKLQLGSPSYSMIFKEY